MDTTARIVEGAPTAIVTVDVEGRVQRINASATDLLGCSPETAIGRPLVELAVPEDLRAEFLTALLGVASGRTTLAEAQRFRTRARGRDGREVPVDLSVVQTSDDPITLTGYASLLDGDARALRRAQRMLEISESVAHVGGWEVDLSTKETRWSQGLVELLGVDDYERPGPLTADTIPFVHEDDRERIGRLIEDVYANPGAFSGGFRRTHARVRLPSGAARHVLASWRVENDAEGTPRWFVGAVQDVTATISTEREIEALHAVARAIRGWQDENGFMDLLRELGTAMRSPVAVLWSMDVEPGKLWCRAFWSAPGFETDDFEAVCRRVPLPPGPGATGLALQNARAEMLPPAADSPYGPTARDLGLRTVMAFPATFEGEPLAVLALTDTEERERDPRLLTTLEDLGAGIGRFLNDRRGELGHQPLSTRELQILRLAAEGQTGPEIAGRLELSPATVKTHFTNVYDKLGAADRAAAVAQAFRLGLLR